MTPLAKVTKVAAQAERGRDALYIAIRDAHTAGKSLRQIAQASGLSHETVRKITRKDTP